MRYAADLHLHSHHSSAVSKNMTVETIGRFARIKGIDVIGTGDCLQPEWLAALESKLEPAEAGWFKPREAVESRVLAELHPSLRRDVRFVLSTEVSCAPAGAERLRGIHHLLYFPSFESAHRFRRRVERHGDLAEGRPTLALGSRELLEIAREHGCEMAPAHVMNPYFSGFGINENHRTLEELFGDLAPRLLAIETGLTSTPDMCRRLSTMDGFGLFSNSDAHSPENIGRECTIIEAEPGFDPMIAALRGGSHPRIVATHKFPLTLTRYYLNRCAACAKSFEGNRCPQCGGRLVMGSRDRLEKIATRAAPELPANSPPYRMFLPLRYLLGEICKTGRASKAVDEIYERLVKEVGSERHILTEAPAESLAAASIPQISQAILAQRREGHRFAEKPVARPASVEVQTSFL